MRTNLSQAAPNTVTAHRSKGEHAQTTATQVGYVGTSMSKERAQAATTMAPRGNEALPSPGQTHDQLGLPDFNGAARNDALQLEVTVKQVLFRRVETNFAVLQTQLSATGESLTAIGPLAHIEAGEELSIQGAFSEHPVHGRRFRVNRFVPRIPGSREGIARYLASGLVSGVGPALAERLVERFGEQTLEVIARGDSAIEAVSGVGPQRAQALRKALEAKLGEAESLALLFAAGLGPNTAARVFRRYGQQTAALVHANPYRMAEEIAGIGFRTADQLGARVGIAGSDPRRVAGAVVHALRRAADDGHLCLPIETLRRGVEALQVDGEAVPLAVEALVHRGTVVVDADCCYLASLHNAERRTAFALAHLAAHPPQGLRKECDEAVLSGLTERQRSAVSATLSTGLLVITGGPGTGKTTTVKAIVSLERSNGRRVLLCAPTGRAAKRLAEVTQCPASTIHRALEWSPASASFSRNEERPLEADLVLVDEASMLDIELADHLLAALPRTSRLVLVGDVDQLPPISPGQVLRELIDSGIAVVVALDQVFRQAQQSAIVRGAHSVLHGETPAWSRPESAPRPSAGHAGVQAAPHQDAPAISANPTAETAGSVDSRSDTREQGSSSIRYAKGKAASASTPRGAGELFFVEAKEADQVASRLLATLHRIEAVYGFHPVRDIQVVTPMRKGLTGTERLNEILQRQLNAHNAPSAKESSPSPPGRLWVGDKVMQLRNDYEREVFNGDVGEVVRIEGGSAYINIDGRQVQYDDDARRMLALAYVSTIHKMQGSEFPAVVVIVHRSHRILLSRALFYTAITRAKQLVVVVGDMTAVARAIQRRDESMHYSQLSRRLQAKIPP